MRKQVCVMFGLGCLIIGLSAGCGGEEAVGNRPVNDPCTNNVDCADNICHLGICASESPKANGEACKGPGDCLSFVCSSGKCQQGKKAAGSDCLKKEECASKSCVSGKCASEAKPDVGTPDSGKPDMGMDLVVDAGLDQSVDLMPDQHVPDQLAPDIPIPDLSASCGDGKKNGTDQCDGTDLGTATCKSQGLPRPARRPRSARFDWKSTTGDGRVCPSTSEVGRR